METLLAPETPGAFLDVGGRGRREARAAGEFDPREILASAVGMEDDYCVGFPGRGGYCIGLVMGIGITRKTFSQAGSELLDAIVAYDEAEVEDTYIGQINMITVSSFCGPRGLIWGYDVARDGVARPPLLEGAEAAEFAGTTLVHGAVLRQATRMLFGTRGRRHFPLLPGSHVPCAGKYRSYEGREVLYAAVAVGIPEERDRHACLLMEDVGRCGKGVLREGWERARTGIILNMVRSVLRIGANHDVTYREIVADAVLREVPEGHIGCALVAAPYFQLARKGYHPDLTRLSLQEWYGLKRRHFLHDYGRDPSCQHDRGWMELLAGPQSVC
ncbi:MAG: histidine decarboxylase, pyruvoyl type [Actinomycetota bacterium]|nr:histidine decarboxylase, pyruvoyl type [Actinomycetota bacterium]